MKPNIPVMVVAVALAAPVAINAMEQRVGRDAEKGDPQRWSEPVTSSTQRYENNVKEAAAALAEAMRDCRGAAERKACVSEARAQHRRDVDAARAAKNEPRS